jgi:E3 ubiquitin-protein ligase BRE1
MREYKREKTVYETELRNLEKRTQGHDEHLRTIDLWFEQVS